MAVLDAGLERGLSFASPSLLQAALDPVIRQLVRDFTIKNIFLATFGIFYDRFGNFVSALGAPFVLTFAVQHAAESPQNNLFDFVLFLIESILSAIIALVTHRLVIIPETVPFWGLRKIGKSEIVFVLYGFVLYMGFAISMQVAASIGAALLLIPLLLFWLWAISRLSLVFPAIATGEFMPFRESWNRTKPHQAKMVMTIIVFPLTAGVALVLLSYIAPPISYLLGPLATVLTVIALSIAYVHVRADRSYEDVA